MLLKNIYNISCILLFSVVCISTVSGSESVSVSVPKASVYPMIDGILEDVWKEADSVTTFIQTVPNEGQVCSEPTTAYFLQDDWAIYVAFRCKTIGRKPDFRLGKRESREGDFVEVFFDTFSDKRNSYYFIVNCAGVQADGILSANGREENSSWDCVFYSMAELSDSGYTVEIAVPWESIQYSKNNNRWHFNLMRNIPQKTEQAYAVQVKQNEGLQIAKFGSLTNISPVTKNVKIDLFPSGFYRTEKSYNETSTDIKPSGEVNIKPNSWMNIQMTFNPDYSQIEADPFALNLSRYSLFFKEKRPFFTEEAEFFKPSGGVMTNLLDLFYSKTIGRKLPDGSEVPLLAGIKITAKTNRFELGSLTSFTGKKTYSDYFGNDVTENNASFFVERVQWQANSQSVIGMQYAGKHDNSIDNQVLSIDGTYDSPTFQFSGQIAESKFNDLSDIASATYFRYNSRKIYISGSSLKIGDNFDVSKIGYVPWGGIENYTLAAGPVFFPEKGLLTYASVKIAATAQKELGENLFSKSITFSLEGAFRNGWGAGLNYQWGKLYEYEDDYNPKAIGFFIQTDVSRRLWNILSVYSEYSYNYLRDYFGRNEYISDYFSSRLSDRFSLYFNSSVWIEHKPDGYVEQTTYRFRPGLSFSIKDGMNLSLYNEIPLNKTNGLLSVRSGLSFSYNFLPKSWLYIAFNEWQVKIDNNFESRQRIFALKFRHLLSL